MNQPLPLGRVPEPIDPELEPLLAEPFAQAFATAAVPAQGALRSRLMQRAAASGAEARTMHTARRARIPRIEPAPGVGERLLYTADGNHAARPGEPLRVRLIELAAGAHWSEPSNDTHREWLVLEGSVHLGSQHLQLRDYHVQPAGTATPALHSEEGAVIFLRESSAPAGAAGTPFTVRDAEAGWPDYAPGIQRRVLWQHAGQAAMLYFTQPGASVPLHTHGHDEECLMVQGELFLDDVLLQAGDYQLAPAGTGHRITQTDTGVVIYAHGDLDLQFVR